MLDLSSTAGNSDDRKVSSRKRAIFDGGIVKAAMPQQEGQGQASHGDAGAEQPVSQAPVTHNEPAHALSHADVAEHRAWMLQSMGQ